MATVVENRGGAGNTDGCVCEEEAPEVEGKGTGSGGGGLESPKPDQVVVMVGIEPKDNCGKVVVGAGGWKRCRVSITLCCKEAIWEAS